MHAGVLSVGGLKVDSTNQFEPHDISIYAELYYIVSIQQPAFLVVFRFTVSFNALPWFAFLLGIVLVIFLKTKYMHILCPYHRLKFYIVLQSIYLFNQSCHDCPFLSLLKILLANTHSNSKGYFANFFTEHANSFRLYASFPSRKFVHALMRILKVSV